MKNIRHGDLSLIGIKKLPAKLIKSDTKVLMVGSGGNDHSITQGKVYLKKDNPSAKWGGQILVNLGAKGVKNPATLVNHIGYVVAPKGCLLLHTDHGEKKKGKTFREIPIEGIFGLIGQVEDTHDGMKAVVD